MDGYYQLLNAGLFFFTPLSSNMNAGMSGNFGMLYTTHPAENICPEYFGVILDEKEPCEEFSLW